MARKRMVTRTIKTAEVEALCMDIVKAEPCKVSVTVSATFKDTADLLKQVSKVVDKENEIKAVSILSVNIKETLYGMDEQKFIEGAEIIPNRGEDSEVEEANLI